MKAVIVAILALVTFASFDVQVSDPEPTIGEPISIEILEPTHEPFQFSYTNKNTIVDVDSSDAVLFVGDSRTVGMYQSTRRDEFSYIAKVSEGFSWLADGTSKYNTSELILNYIEANPEGKIVFNLGVNDLYKQSNYVEWMRCLVENYPYLSIYYLSINPSTRSSLDSQIDSFNLYIQNNLSETVTWIDSNTYLKETGYSTPDGVHYDSATYNKILDFVLESLCVL